MLKSRVMARGATGLTVNVCAALALGAAGFAQAQAPPSPADGVVLATGSIYLVADLVAPAGRGRASTL